MKSQWLVALPAFPGAKGFCHRIILVSAKDNIGDMKEQPPTYVELKKQQSDELNDFPMFFAFNKKQFEEGRQRLNVQKGETLVRIPGGGFIKKIDAAKLESLFDKFDAEMEASMQDREWLTNAIEYELSNHEYAYTLTPNSALQALGITLDSKKNKECYTVARQRYMKDFYENN